MEKYGFVYIWYDRKRKMYYIGSHWGAEDDGYLCSSNRMRDAYRRRPNDFKRRILSRVYTSRQELYDKEQDWFDLVKKPDQYYNLNFQVNNGTWWLNEETKLTVGQKISKANKGRVGTFSGKRHSEETKERIRQKKTGTILTEEHKAKISAANMGREHSEECRAKISATLTGQSHSEERIAAIRKGRQGKSTGKRSEECKAKISAIHKGKPKSPEHVAKMAAAKRLYRKHYQFFDPDGNLHNVEDIVPFCKERNLCPKKMGRLYGGTYGHPSYKGWKSAK